jgi:hypothetical protein
MKTEEICVGFKLMQPKVCLPFLLVPNYFSAAFGLRGNEN